MAAPPGTEMKRTLTMTGLTINAMALIAPGAFLWTTFQVQVVQSNGGLTTATDMVPGLIFVLVLAFLTAFSYAELSNIYPDAGGGSSYYFAEAAFLEKERTVHYRFARLAKFVVGWVSHLYYWVYPGIMVAFTATLLVYVLGLFGIALVSPLQIAAAFGFALLVGLVAYRGITGSTLTAVIVNAIQLTALIGFALLAIAFRSAHPDLAYAHSNLGDVVLPHNLSNVVFQGTIAILLLVGFESATALGGEALNPKRDVRRAILLSLAIQGAIAYVLEYAAANFFVNGSVTATASDGSTASGYAAAAASAAPIGEMVRFIGDTWLGGGTGFALVLILAATVMVALIGTTLTCLNAGVRITYAMGRDREVPGILGMLHFRHATPHYGVVALTVTSALLGGYAVLSADNLLQVILASNTGTFLVYGMTNALVLFAFGGAHRRNVFKHVLVPVLGMLANAAMLAGVILMGLSAGGSTQTDALIALGVVTVWVVVGAIWLILNSASTRTSLLVKPAAVGPER
jgi:APA family basic amino acid/polyamine antiporter